MLCDYTQLVDLKETKDKCEDLIHVRGNNLIWCHVIT